jgi:hypothetical protein
VVQPLLTAIALFRRGAQFVQQRYPFGVFQAELEKILGECGR